MTCAGFLLAYITVGAVASSNILALSLIDGYYFVLIFLSRIDLNLIEVNNDKIQAEISYFIYLACFVYFIVGICLASLILQRINSEIKSILYKNTRSSILKLIALLNRFGYRIEEENIDFEFYTVSDNQSNLLKSATDFNMDADHVGLSFNDNLTRRASRYKRAESCDKQTQITTLLCSKLIKVS
jgi:hypothetical protein